MNYILHYDVCAIMIFAFTIYFLISQKGMKRVTNKVLLLFVSIGLISSVFDILSAIANSNPEKYSVFIRDLFNYVYLISHNCMPATFLVYILMSMGMYRKFQKWKFVLVLVPLFLVWTLFALNPYMRWIFAYDENGDYYHGKLMIVLYILAFVYMLAGVVHIIVIGKAVSINRRIALVFFVVIGIASVAFQIFYPHMLIELFAQSIGILGIMINTKNEEDTLSSLTGLYNRQAFVDENNIALGNKSNYSIINFKITNLKYYYSLLGLENVNIIIKEIGYWFQKKGKRGTVYYCGDGDFALIMYKAKEGDYERITNEIKEKLSTGWHHEGMDILFNAIISVIKVPENVDTIEKIMLIIDTEFENPSDKVAIDKISVIKGEQLGFLQRNIDVEKAILKAIDNRSFQVYYQPIWDSKTKKIHSAEALIRLFDDDLGFIPPDEFIPLSEKNGTIIKIGTFVFEEVCKILSESKIREYGIEFLEVNLSTIQCMHKKLPEIFKSILDKYSIEPSLINLEITESAAINSPEIFTNTIKKLKEMGFTFTMDDYGTGYSNFSYMFDMDFDIIKLDKSILWNADKSESAKIILNNSIRMLKEMHLQIVMEGVETEVQKQHVTDLGCDYCQGYYFSRPIKKEEFIEFCENYNK